MPLNKTQSKNNFLDSPHSLSLSLSREEVLGLSFCGMFPQLNFV